jgi:hypothetical protein
MHSTLEELALLEAAALRSETSEEHAEKCFDSVYGIAESTGSVAALTATPEFARWMAARAETDAAWGRWAECMDLAAALDQKAA